MPDDAAETWSLRRPNEKTSVALADSDLLADVAHADSTVESWSCPATHRWQLSVVCGFLLLAVGLVYGQTIHFQFVNIDDDWYVYGNRQVRSGLTLPGIVWAFSQSHASNWHPVSWLSHMLDCQLYGLEPGGHHLTNVLLHGLTSVLLFLVLRSMTGRMWPSALVATLFAVHPLHVESVAWVAERKDVLSGLFFVLTLGAYVRYARHPFSLWRYLMVMLLFALGLMSKSMLVTLPFVLMLLDYWPLGRLEARGLRFEEAGRMSSGLKPPASTLKPQVSSLLAEKLPLFALAVAICAVTLSTQTQSIQTSERFPFMARISNAMVAYAAYLGQFFFPARLANFYPYPKNALPVWQVAGALVLLAAITVGAVLWRRRCPYLAVGWFWYLGMLVPVIGLVQVGTQSMADRYTYLSQIGLYMALAWGLADVCGSRPHRRWLCGIASAAAVATLMGCAWRQTSYWQNNDTLWRHALAVTSQNQLAHNNLANALHAEGKIDEAIIHFEKALAIDPRNAFAHSNLGATLAEQGKTAEAIAHYRAALETEPEYSSAHSNLAAGLTIEGKYDEAIEHCKQALKNQPDYAEAHGNLANALARRGDFDEAAAEYEQSLELQPEAATVHLDFANALDSQGQVDKSIAQFERALQINPRYTAAHYNLANLLARQNNNDQAIAHYEKALEISPAFASGHNNIAAALMAKGRTDDAIAHYRKALEIQPDLAMAHLNLGIIMAEKGKVDEAVALYERALELEPNQPTARARLGTVLYDRGKVREAVSHWREAVRLGLNDLGVLHRLTWVLATSADDLVLNGPKAVEFGDRAVQLSGGREPAILDSLAAAYAATGQFNKAVQVATQGLLLAGSQDNNPLAAAIRQRIALYRAGLPYREAR